MHLSVLNVTTLDIINTSFKSDFFEVGFQTNFSRVLLGCYSALHEQISLVKIMMQGWRSGSSGGVLPSKCETRSANKKQNKKAQGRTNRSQLGQEVWIKI
jgi:hypothetical protein